MRCRALRAGSILIGLSLLFCGCHPAVTVADPTVINGKACTRAAFEEHREDLQNGLRQWLYGQIPTRREPPTVLAQTRTPLPEQKAEEWQVTLSVGRGLTEKLRLVIPDGKGPFPVILRLDYLCDRQYRAPIEDALTATGQYAFVTVERRLLAPDEAEDRNVNGLTQYEKEDMGAIGLWAMGAMAAMDYVETLPRLDRTRVCVTGHSRDGKAAVAAAALDTRFAAVVPHAAGVGGTASFTVQNESSETAADLARNLPHWFTAAFDRAALAGEKLPIDMIDAFALIAPRAVLRLEAGDDLWSNPYGSYRTMLAADSVYRLYGEKTENNGMWLRTGDHDMTREDWDCLAEFCDYIFYKKISSRNFRTEWYETDR